MAPCPGTEDAGSETDQAELCISEPGRKDTSTLLGCADTDEGDNSEQRREHWSGLRKPSWSPGPASTGLCGLEEVTKLQGTRCSPLSTAYEMDLALRPLLSWVSCSARGLTSKNGPVSASLCGRTVSPVNLGCAERGSVLRETDPVYNTTGLGSPPPPPASPQGQAPGLPSKAPLWTWPEPSLLSQASRALAAGPPGPPPSPHPRRLTHREKSLSREERRALGSQPGAV